VHVDIRPVSNDNVQIQLDLATVVTYLGDCGGTHLQGSIVSAFGIHEHLQSLDPMCEHEQGRY